MDCFDDIPRVQMGVLTPAEIRAEEIMLGLRTREGVPENLLEGRDLSRVANFLAIESGRVRLTRRGLAVMNSVLAEIL